MGWLFAVWALVFLSATARAGNPAKSCARYSDVGPGKGAEETFTAQKKIGSAAIVSVPGASIQFDANSPGWKSLVSPLGEKATLTHDEIRAFLSTLQNRPLRRLHKKEGEAIDLIDALDSEAHRNTALSIISQILFERHTKLDTRLVVDKLDPKAGPVLLAKGKKGAWRIMDHRTKEEPDGTAKMYGLPRVNSEGREWVDGKKGFTVLTAGGDAFEINVKPEKAAEKQFKAEGKAFADAKPEDPVTVEWIFHPFYRPFGHTSVRIGNEVYELSRTEGWRAHNDGADSARGFLFSNPYFKGQYAAFQDQGMAPYSVGATLKVPKAKALAFLEAIREKTASPEKDPFCFLTNNCNQGMLRAMAGVGINGMPSGSGYLGFSSVLTFQKLMHGDLGIQPESLNAYPITGVELTQDQARSTFPKTLSEPNGVLPEIWRNVTEPLGDWWYSRGRNPFPDMPPPGEPARRVPMPPGITSGP